MDKPRMHALRKDEAREARVRAWRYVFDCYEKKKACVGDNSRVGHEAEEEKNDRPGKSAR